MYNVYKFWLSIAATAGQIQVPLHIMKIPFRQLTLDTNVTFIVKQILFFLIFIFSRPFSRGIKQFPRNCYLFICATTAFTVNRKPSKEIIFSFRVFADK